MLIGDCTQSGLHLCRVVTEWQSCAVLQLMAVESNPKAQRFWSGLGFVPQGDVETIHLGNSQSLVRRDQRSLSTAS
jgi:hypothetical protein